MVSRTLLQEVRASSSSFLFYRHRTRRISPTWWFDFSFLLSFLFYLISFICKRSFFTSSAVAHATQTKSCSLSIKLFSRRRRRRSFFDLTRLYCSYIYLQNKKLVTFFVRDFRSFWKEGSPSSLFSRQKRVWKTKIKISLKSFSSFARECECSHTYLERFWTFSLALCIRAWGRLCHPHKSSASRKGRQQEQQNNTQNTNIYHHHHHRFLKHFSLRILIIHSLARTDRYFGGGVRLCARFRVARALWDIQRGDFN